VDVGVIKTIRTSRLRTHGQRHIIAPAQACYRNAPVPAILRYLLAGLPYDCNWDARESVMQGFGLINARDAYVINIDHGACGSAKPS
jgi:hypothetical protein